MLGVLLNFFPTHAHSLILASDPDAILAGDSILAALVEQGYRILEDDDPVRLRHRYQQIQPHTFEQPVLVVTTGPLNQLPYDLWQQGHHVNLALHILFPNLDYPVLRQLSPGQLGRLAQVETPATHPLSPHQTQDFLLAMVFGAIPEQLARPAPLLLWLDDYHARNDPMPPLLAGHLLMQLQDVPALANWPLERLLTDVEAYRQFVQGGWEQYVRHRLGEAGVEYQVVLPFENDPTLQDALPRFLRTGTLSPLVVEEAAALPRWARPAVAVDEAGKQLRQFQAGLAAVADALNEERLHWADWQAVARRWAALTLLRHGSNLYLEQVLLDRAEEVQRQLDLRFQTWLQTHYTLLANRTLPVPHHLYHVPTYLAHTYPRQRVALLVLDGMALADWLLLKESWQARHAEWQMAEQLLLAQVPCITPVSRQALIGGQRPALFAESLTHNRYDARGWMNFWRSRDLPDNAIAHETLPDRADTSLPAAIDSRHTRALCLVSTLIDEIVHGATQGTGDVLASLRVWLQAGSRWLERLIQELLVHDYRVVLASDHGHVAAVGMGQPQEGVMVESRSQRARLYNNADFAQTVHSQYPHTVLWHDDGLLPAGWWTLVPQRRYAFAPAGQQVVSHGGLTIEEMVVPLVTIA